METISVADDNDVIIKMLEKPNTNYTVYSGGQLPIHYIGNNNGKDFMEFHRPDGSIERCLCLEMYLHVDEDEKKRIDFTARKDSKFCDIKVNNVVLDTKHNAALFKIIKSYAKQGKPIWYIGDVQIAKGVNKITGTSYYYFKNNKNDKKAGFLIDKGEYMLDC